MPMPAAVCLPFPLAPLPSLRAGLELELEEPLLADRALALVVLALARDELAPDLRAELPLRLLRDDEPDARLPPLRDEPDDPLRLLRDGLDPLDDAFALRLLLEDPCALLDDARPRLELSRSLATDMVHLPDAGR